MKPALITRSGSYAATSAVRARSQSALLAWSCSDSTKVGMLARAARSNPWMPGRSEPTATISAPYAGSAQASISACSRVPLPEISTTSRAARPRRVAARGSGTTHSLATGYLPGGRAAGDLTRDQVMVQMSGRSRRWRLRLTPACPLPRPDILRGTQIPSPHVTYDSSLAEPA